MDKEDYEKFNAVLEKIFALGAGGDRDKVMFLRRETPPEIIDNLIAEGWLVPAQLDEQEKN